MSRTISVAVDASRAHGPWTIDNGLVRCEVGRGAVGSLVWSLACAGRTVVGPTLLPALAADGRLLLWAAGVTASECALDDGSRALCLEAMDGDGTLLLRRFVQLYPAQPFVRFWGSAENAGASAVRITASEILRLAVPVAPRPKSEGSHILFHVEQFSWVHRPDFFSQHQVRLHPGYTPAEVRMGSFPSRTWAQSSCAWFALRDGLPDRVGAQPQCGAGLVAGIEFNGKSRLQAWCEPGDGQHCTHLVSTIDALNHRLEPGESFEVPAFFIGAFEGDWDEAGYVTQRFAEQHVHPPMPDERYPWVQYNSWGYGQVIDEAQQLAAIERCAALGVEVAVLDLGWAAQIGEWRADPVKFPRGLAPVAALAHRLGLGFGVHIPIAQANPGSPVGLEHPDWLIHTGDDYFGAAPLCLGHRPCREWLIGELLRLIDDCQLDYIVHDGEDMVKHCHKSSHTHEPGDSNYSNSTAGLDVVVDTIRSLRPHVIWENCEDGGCMLTYKMARSYHSTITVDNIATYATRQGVYGASYPFSPRYSVRYMQDDPTPYTLRSAIFGGPLILMQQVTKWDEAQMAATRAAIQEYKQLRSLVRDAKIIHLLPPRYNVEGVGWGWDAIQAVSPDRKRSVVMAYRAVGGRARQTLRPRGLLSEALYRVAGAGAPAGALSGEQLARDGIPLRLEQLASEVIWLTAE